MKNSLRKRLYRILIKYDLLFIQTYPHSTFDRSIKQIFLGIQIKDEFYKLKHEEDRIVLMYDFANPLRKFLDYADFRLDSYFINAELEPIDVEFFDYLMKPISDLIKLNPKTYKFPKYIYVDNKGYYDKQST